MPGKFKIGQRVKLLNDKITEYEVIHCSEKPPYKYKLRREGGEISENISEAFILGQDQNEYQKYQIKVLKDFVDQITHETIIDQGAIELREEQSSAGTIRVYEMPEPSLRGVIELLDQHQIAYVKEGIPFE